MKVIAYVVRVSIEGAIVYVSYYGFSTFWWVLFNPYSG